MQMVMTAITAQQVESAVRRYWRVLADKRSGEMTGFYSYDAVVFHPFAVRPEPGRVSAARKEREYFDSETIFKPEIVGHIEVQVLSDDLAIASYNFRWKATNMKHDVLGNRHDKAVRDGRATQLFRLTPEGELKIVNEHLSDVWRDK
jgi:ketosteroid isomerase-like protein